MFCTVSLYSQNSQKELNLLTYKGKAFQLILADINNFIANKSNGYLYPVSKVVVTGNSFNNSVEFEIRGIDNSWSYLFDMDEIPYGYIILDNRLFVVAYKNTASSVMANLFEVGTQSKNFTTQAMFPPSTTRNPSWFFEYKDNKYIWLRGENLDVFQ